MYLESKIIKLPDGRYRVVKKDGTGNLGTYKTKEQATKRLREIEIFKHMKSEMFKNF